VDCFATHFLVPVFLFEKAPPIGNTQNPTGRGILDPSRMSQVLPLRKKNGYLRDLWCAGKQPTKHWKIAVCSV